jgi:hypothetical protein
MIIPNSEIVTFEAYNIWGGKAAVSLDSINLEEENINFDESSTIWYAILGLIAATVLWRESRRILRWLGFSTID